MQSSREYQESWMNFPQRKKKTRQNSRKQMRKGLCLMEQENPASTDVPSLKRSRKSQSL